MPASEPHSKVYHRKGVRSFNPDLHCTWNNVGESLRVRLPTCTYIHYVCVHGLQALTGGNGFYLSEGKETLWTGRKLVIRNKDTGQL